MTHATAAHLGEALGTDFFTVREQFTPEQWDRFATVRRFVDEEVIPAAAGYWERAEIPWPLVRRLPELGIVGEDIKGYGCAGMSPMACGLQADITLDNVRVPAGNRLPGARSFKDTSRVWPPPAAPAPGRRLSPWGCTAATAAWAWSSACTRAWP